MKVNLISINSSIDEIYKISRPHLTEIPSEIEFVKMNMPISQFKRYVLHIESSILFRDLMFTFRPIVAWARSNRTSPYTRGGKRLAIDEISYIDKSKFRSAKDKLETVFDLVDKGEQQDFINNKMPMFVSTEYCMDIDLRQLINIVYTFESHCHKYFEIFYGALSREITQFPNLYESAFKVDLFNKVSITDEEKNYGEVHEQIGGMHMIKVRIAHNLQGQFIRQHSSIIKNGLWNLASEDLSNLIDKTGEMEIDVICYLLHEQLFNLSSTRSCWFAKMDHEDNNSWSYVLKDYIKKLDPKQFLQQLPCQGKCDRCKIKADMMPKIYHKEINPPCPIFLENPYIIDQRVEQYNSDSEIMKKWMECKKYIRFNPNNKYNKVYGDTEYLDD